MKQNEERRFDEADITFRRSALRTNSGIHARRHGPALLPVLSGAGIRTRYIAQMAWLGSEAVWRDTDARRIGEIAAEIVRFGRGREPEIAETCEWHAARLRELVSQQAVLRRLEGQQCRPSPWPDAAARTSPPRRKPVRPGSRR